MGTHFEGRHVVVTGGAGGLGRAVVAHLVDEGATCHVPLFGPELARPFEGPVHATPSVDLSDEAAVQAYYAGLPGLWASVHLAGGFAMAPVGETSLAAFQRQHLMNTVTCFLCCREASRRMVDGGRIVNVSARPALEPTGGMVAYAVSKAGVAALTRALAAELRDRDIGVNAIVPSIIDTRANRRAMPDADHDRWPRPDQIARTIGWLASPANALTSGALVPVYGGV